jgi:hypothetical protein
VFTVAVIAAFLLNKLLTSMYSYIGLWTCLLVWTHSLFPEYDYREWRAMFDDASLLANKPPKGHVHGVSAGHRTRAQAAIEEVITRSGRKPYSYQASRKDQERGLAGLRTFHWAKDMTTRAQNDRITGDLVPMMIDVDYYVDMPAFLADMDRPVLLYTFQPSAPADTQPDYCYTFLDETTFRYSSTGAGEYEHEVWDWSTLDVVKCSSYLDCGLFRIPWRTSTWSVSRREVDPHHQMVLLVPLSRHTLVIGAALANLFLQSPDLRRLKLECPDPNIAIFHRQAVGKNEVCVARKGTYDSCILPTRVYEELWNMALTAKNDLTGPCVESVLKKHGIKEETGRIMPLLLRLEGYVPQPATTRKPPPEAYHYRYMSSEDDIIKPSMVPFMKPIGSPPFVPQNSLGNELQMAKGRITSLATDTLLVDDVRDFLVQFVDYIIPESERHSVVPESLDAVVAKQKRPSQRRIIVEASMGPSDDETTSFMKKEPYVKITDPRPITMKGPGTKVLASRYMYAAASWLKRHASDERGEWYAFSLTPREFANRIAQDAEQSEAADEGDGSRWDGRVNSAARFLYDRFFRRLFAPEYHAELREMLDKLVHVWVRAYHGTKYWSEDAQQSGDPFTSFCNSLLGKCIDTHSRVRAGQPFLEAFRARAKFGGDDAISFDHPDPACVVTTGRIYGHEFEVNHAEKKRGDSFSMLSRIYPATVWYGAPDSYCQITRSTSAFNVTTTDMTTMKAVDKLLAKSFAYYLSDRNTPYIGHFVSRVCELAHDRLMEWRREGCGNDGERSMALPWNARIHAESEQYPNSIATDNTLVPGHLNLPLLREALAKCRCLEDLLDLPVCYNVELNPLVNRPIPLNVVVNNEKAGDIDPAKMLTKADLKVDSKPDQRVADRLLQLRRVLEPFVKTFDRSRAFNWLDVGSGDGVVINGLAKEYPLSMVTAFDPLRQRVCHKSDSPNVVFIQLLDSKAVFDLITFHMVLHHMKDWRKELLKYLDVSTNVIVIREHDCPKEMLKEMTDLHQEPRTDLFFSARGDVVGFMMSKGWYPCASSSYPKAENKQRIYTVAFARADHPVAVQVAARDKLVKAQKKEPTTTASSTTSKPKAQGVLEVITSGGVPIAAVVEDYGGEKEVVELI